jgi:hypothetical protein
VFGEPGATRKVSAVPTGGRPTSPAEKVAPAVVLRKIRVRVTPATRSSAIRSTGLEAVAGIEIDLIAMDPPAAGS